MGNSSYFRWLFEQSEVPQAALHHAAIDEAIAGEPQVLVVDDLYAYRVADDVLAHGSSLGNAHAWLTSKGTGALEELFSTDLGMPVFGSFELGYFARYRDITAEAGVAVEREAGLTPDRLVRLSPVGRGSFVLHPAYQQHHFVMTGQVEILETFFLPHLHESDDPCAVFVVTEVRNRSNRPFPLLINAAVMPMGDATTPVDGRYEPDTGLLLRDHRAPERVRLIASTPYPGAYLVSDDFDVVANPLDCFSNEMQQESCSYAGIQHLVTLGPDETQQIAYVLLFHPQGDDAAMAQYSTLPPADDTLRRTVEAFREQLLTADVMTPDTYINQGALWCKANMLRVLASYPTGLAITNDPGKSSHVVARDSAWYVYGSDAFQPDASCTMLLHFADVQEEDGKIPEYYDALTGKNDDYGLNINDSTALFVLAVTHHLKMTEHEACRKALMQPMCRALDYMLAQRDDRGLIYCTADGTGGHGICGWRNAMAGERISGAVTEVNSECYAAVTAAAEVLKAYDPVLADRYQAEAQDLRKAVNRHLLNPQTGMYYLTLDVNGRPRTDITADLVFPLMFDVADTSVKQLISERLGRTDMLTSGGIRTVPNTSLSYHPDRSAGLTGGIWPGVAWWYAMGSAQVDRALMVKALSTSYRQFLRNPKVYGTVPGQFCEWLDGESLINRGMRLSPWEPPRFLWAVLEGLYGITPGDAGFAVNLCLPEDWNWCLLRRFPFRGRLYSWFMGKVMGRQTFYTCAPFSTTESMERYDEEVTSHVSMRGEQATVIAWRRERELVVAIGTEAGEKVPVPLEISEALLSPNRTYTLQVYRSEAARWAKLPPRNGADLQRFSLWLEAGGFAIIRIYG